MKLPPQEKARLLQEPRCLELLDMFPLPEGEHVTTALLSHLPKMSDGAFQTFKEFLIQQSKAECGVQDLHLEQVGRLAAFLVGDDAERSTAYLQIALNWLNEGKIGLASSSPLRRSQSFWYCMRNGRLPAS